MSSGNEPSPRQNAFAPSPRHHHSNNNTPTAAAAAARRLSAGGAAAGGAGGGVSHNSNRRPSVVLDPDVQAALDEASARDVLDAEAAAAQSAAVPIPGQPVTADILVLDRRPSVHVVEDVDAEMAMITAGGHSSPDGTAELLDSPEPAEQARPLTSASRRYIPPKKKALPTLDDVERRLAKSDTFGEHKARVAIDPRGEFMKRWDLVVMGLLIYTALVTPFDIGFVPDTGTIPVDSGLYWVNQLVNILFFVDLIVNLFLAFFDPKIGSWVFTAKRTMLRYMKGWFVLDLVSIIPFELLGIILGSDQLSSLKVLRIIRLLRLAKLARIFRASRVLKRIESQFEISNATMSLVKFIAMVVITAHWIACAWAIVATFEEEPDNWKTFYGMHDMPMDELYATCFYYAIIVLPTGVGDIVPVTVLERVVCTISMMIGGSVYAYVIGAVCGVVATQDPASTEFYQTMDHLNAFLLEVKAPTQKKLEIREYFHYCRDLFKAHHFHDVIFLMSPKLRGDIALHTHGAWISSIPFFSAKNVEERNTFIAAIALALQREAYAPKENIIHQGEYCEKMYIIQRGLAARLGQVFGAGRYFGEDVILHNTRRNYFVRVLTYLDVYALCKGDLEGILENGDFPQTRMLIRKAAIKLSLSREMKRMSAQIKLARRLAADSIEDSDGSAGKESPRKDEEAQTPAREQLQDSHGAGFDGFQEEAKEAHLAAAAADDQLMSPLSKAAADVVVLRNDDQVAAMEGRLQGLSGMLDTMLQKLAHLPTVEEFDSTLNLLAASHASMPSMPSMPSKAGSLRLPRGL